jgi:Methyltransferase domain
MRRRLTRLCVALRALSIYQAGKFTGLLEGAILHDRAKRGILLKLRAPRRPELDGVPEPRILACKLCGGKSRVVFGLPHNKKAGHPIPDEPDDCWYYQCDACNFLFTPALDAADHTVIYDENYWDNQDPDWYGRVSQTFRLVAMANELLRSRIDRFEILDFGCGAGGFLEMGRNHLALKVWGTDINPPKVGKEWFLSDLETRKFDVITACEVIEHLPNPRETFAKLRERLKSPGVFAFQTGQWDPKVLGREWWYLGPDNGHISLYSREGLDHVFREMGGVGRRMWTDYPGCQAWLFA